MNARIPETVLPTTPASDEVLLELEGGIKITAETSEVPCWAIVADDSANPRKFYEPEAFESLKSSIADVGVQSEVWVRIKDNQLVLIAGYRRLRAAIEVFGDDYLIPIDLKFVDDASAEKLSLLENHERDDISPYEEAVKAAKTLADHNGNKLATAKFLGWPVKTLENRIALLNLHEDVAKHLVERRIDVPTAELLVTISKDRQIKAISTILEQEAKGNKLSPKEIAAFIRKQSMQFSTAIFDKTDCTTCPHNSTHQTTLFADSIGEGMCTHDTCFNDKQEAEITARLALVAEEVPRAERITQEHRNRIIKITVDGAKGIGEEQANACRSCANFGGGVSVMPDSFGNTFSGQCFDTKCYGTKIANVLKQSTQASPAGETGSPEQPGEAKKQAGAGTKQAAEKPPVTEVALSERVKQYRLALWRKVLQAHVTSDKGLSVKALVGLMAASHANHVSSSEVKASLKTKSVGFDEVFASAQSLSNEECVNVILVAVSSIISVMPESSVVGMLGYYGIKLQDYWKIDKDFLSLLTRSEIDFLAKAYKIDLFMGDKYKAAMSKQKADFVVAILESGFSFDGIIPAVISFNK
ncbi:PRTRC system ParB family protein [Flavobacterium sp.]|uniref:PRTRC system ParB family protein n=1 Tax=Flavobacterium sp. TaxID=239 RepID=UPI0026158075|nr:PRTRC system ParB family protein [Flavobacterium sp.]